MNLEEEVPSGSESPKNSKSAQMAVYRSFLALDDESRNGFFKRVLKTLPLEEVIPLTKLFREVLRVDNATYQKSVKLGRLTTDGDKDPLYPILLEWFLNGGDLFRAMAIRELYPTLDPRTQIELRREQQMVIPLDYALSPIKMYVDSLKELKIRSRSVHKEPETVKWIETELKPGDVFFDIGANIGAYSLVAGVQPSRATVYAFEPSFANYYQLYRNVILNNLQKQVFPLPFALSDATSAGTLSLTGTDEGLAENYLEREDCAPPIGLSPGIPQLAFTYALDDCLATFNIPCPTLCKIDVDGHEAYVLRGASETLKRPELRQVFVEIDTNYPEQAREIEAIFQASGFQSRVLFKKEGGRNDTLFFRG